MMGSDSEDEQHDAYLERMKQEAADRDDEAGNNEGSSDEDEDFNPANQPSEEVFLTLSLNKLYESTPTQR